MFFIFGLFMIQCGLSVKDGSKIILFADNGKGSDCGAGNDVLMTGAEYVSLLQAGANPEPEKGGVDYAEAGAVFSFFFGVMISCWLTAKAAGMVVNAVKRF